MAGRDWGEVWNEESVFTGHGISGRDDGRVLKMATGAGCTTLWIYFEPLNHSFKDCQEDKINCV